MIEFISGNLAEKNPNTVIIDANGIGYKVFISLNTYNDLPDINNKIKIMTYFNVTEKNQELFGFNSKIEKEMFEMLISVSGIGPKIAINLLSFVKPNDFKQRIISAEVESLTSLPGIGAKTAKRIIIELKDKLTSSKNNELPIENNSDVDSDAYSALINLGFKSNEVRNTLSKINQNTNDISTEDKIKKALRILR